MKEDVRTSESEAEEVAEERESRALTDTKREPETQERASLFEEEHAEQLRARWSEVQGRFVDDPRASLKAADALVAEVIRDLSSLFSAERTTLERQLGSQEKVSTEDLRVAVRRYRSFFERLLSV
jgi:hypothetical protein